MFVFVIQKIFPDFTEEEKQKKVNYNMHAEGPLNDKYSYSAKPYARKNFFNRNDFFYLKGIKWSFRRVEKSSLIGKIYFLGWWNIMLDLSVYPQCLPNFYLFKYGFFLRP